MYNPVTNPTYFVLDPNVDTLNGAAFAGIWLNVTGTPSLASNKYRFNQAEAIVRADLLGAHVGFNLTIPAAPTSGDVRQWGLKHLALGNRSKIFFDITDAVFSVNSYDDNGLVTFSQPITWQTAWTNVPVRFTIDWFEDRVVFRIIVESTGTASTFVIKTDGSTPPLPVVGYQPLNPFIKNSNNDNVDCSYVIVKARTSTILLT